MIGHYDKSKQYVFVFVIKAYSIGHYLTNVVIGKHTATVSMVYPPLYTSRYLQTIVLTDIAAIAKILLHNHCLL